MPPWLLREPRFHLGSDRPGSVLGANGDIRVAVVGFNSRGMDHINGFQKGSGSTIGGLCDVDQDVLNKEAKRQADAGNPVATYTDVRKLSKAGTLTLFRPRHQTIGTH